MSYNTIDFRLIKSLPPTDEGRELGEKLIEILSEIISESEKLSHLDLTGCNFGERAGDLGNAIQKSTSLQAIHLSFNGIPEETKEQLYTTLRVNHRARKTREQV